MRRRLVIRWLGAPGGRFVCMLGLAVALCAASAAPAEVTLSLAPVESSPGAEVVLPLMLAGKATPGIVSLSIKLSYPSAWLSFVDFRQGDLVLRGGLMAMANATTQGDEQVVLLGLAGAEPLPGDGRLGELVFRVASTAPLGAAARLTFGPTTQANRGEPRLATVSGMIGLRREPDLADLDGDHRVDIDDFFLFADHFGTDLGETGYLFDCDLNMNGSVEFEDFFLFADMFGTVY